MSELTLEAAESFPAKTVKKEEGVSLGISVMQHGLLAGEVLRELRSFCAFPKKDSVFPESLVGVAGLHDIGKENPLFLKKLLKNVTLDQDGELDLSEWQALSETEPDLAEIRHATAGKQIVKAGLGNRFCADVVGGHHGFFPEGRIESLESPAFGGEGWIKARDLLMAEILDKLGVKELPQKPGTIDLRRELKDVWTGLVVVSDWIASRQEEGVPPGEEKAFARKLVEEAGFAPLQIDKKSTFESVFGFSPRREQQQFISMYEGPGAYVLEAPTGCGKTEAALGLAFEAIRRGDASGIFFALPTQLTSNKILGRMKEAVERVVRQAPGGVQLVHGNARLLKAKFGGEASPQKNWFTSNRQALLAPFGVGTIDQLLLGLLNVKFASIRSASLVGKIIILDEIHSYDAYTSEFVEQLIKRIQDLGGTVVVLSATLTNESRDRLLELDGEAKRKAESPILMTSKIGERVNFTELPASEESRKRVKLRLLEDPSGESAEAEAFSEALSRVRAGQQVIWIENTVSAAQKTYERFLSQGVVSGLLHSRFRGVDRDRQEDIWTGIFGRDGGEQRTACGHVLVGTQVLEQSLDLDADFMVTRIAPMDLLIQRFGRLWRHKRVRPAGCESPEAWILASPEDGSLRKEDDGPIRRLFGTSGVVYGPPYILHRTLSVLKERLAKGKEVDFPDEVRLLMQKTYGEQDEVPGSEEAELKEELKALTDKLSLRAWGMMGVGKLDSEFDDEYPSTRYIELASSPVLVLTQEDLKSVPSGLNELALWLEERVVKSSKRVEGQRAEKESCLPSAVKDFILKSDRFSRMPVAILAEDRFLRDLTGGKMQVGKKAIRYSQDSGLGFAEE